MRNEYFSVTSKMTVRIRVSRRHCSILVLLEGACRISTSVFGIDEECGSHAEILDVQLFQRHC